MMRWVRLACLMAVLPLLPACGVAHRAGVPATSRVAGTVLAGPIAPLARPGEPANRPVPGATVEALRGNAIVAVVHTSEAGHYELTVPPGTYLIVVKDNKYLQKMKSKKVTVSAGETLKVGFVLDTGIR